MRLHKKYMIPGIIASLIIIVIGFLIYRHLTRPEEWRLYIQIKSKHPWMQYLDRKMGCFDFNGRREIALKKLIKLGGKARAPLVELLRDKDELVRDAAQEALLENFSDSVMIEFLITLLKDENNDPNARKAAARTLFEILGKPYEYLYVTDPNERSWAVSTWNDLDGIRVLKTLIKYMHVKSPELRACITYALGQFIGIYCTEDIDNIFLKFDFHSYFDDNKEKSRLSGSVEDLLTFLSDKDPKIRSQAAHDLLKVGDDRAILPLIKCLKDIDPDVRMHAARFLGRIGDQQVVKPLKECLRDQNQAVKNVASTSLELIKYKTDASSQIRAAIYACFKESIKTLVTFLSDRDKRVRRSAAYTLRYILDSTATDPLVKCLAIDPLIKCLHDKDHEVRMDSAAALGYYMVDSRVVEPLIKCLQDTNPEVRIRAAAALERIQDARAINPLIECLQDKDHDVRFYVMLSLESFISNPRAFMTIVKCLRAKDERIQKRARDALRSNSDSQNLKKALRSEDMKFRQSLKRALQKAAQDQNEEVKELAKKVLKELNSLF